VILQGWLLALLGSTASSDSTHESVVPARAVTQNGFGLSLSDGLHSQSDILVFALDITSRTCNQQLLRLLN